MGGGSFSMRAYQDTSKKLNTQRREEIFSKKVDHRFKVNHAMIRECVASDEHPRPVPFIIGLDVTGSMGILAETLAKKGLGNIMQKILECDNIKDAQLMFAAIGDGFYDNTPLQVTQFESDNRMLEQLTALYLEGGGGGNDYESYTAVHAFALSQVRSSHTTLGYKGMIITIGDEPTKPYLYSSELDNCGINKGDLPRHNEDHSKYDAVKIIDSLSNHYDIFHILVNSRYRNALPSWRNLLGKRVLVLDERDDHSVIIPELIVALYELQNMTSPDQATEIMGKYNERTRGIISEAFQRT